MLKRYLGFLKNVIIILSIFIITALIFIYGVDIFQPNNPYNNPSIIDNKYIQFIRKLINIECIQLFYKFINSEGRENWLIPIGTFCSALSTFATVYLIWLQQKTIKKHDLEISSERAVSHFFMLLEQHRKIIDSLYYPNDIQEYNKTIPIKKYDAIDYYLETLKVHIHIIKGHCLVGDSDILMISEKINKIFMKEIGKYYNQRTIEKDIDDLKKIIQYTFNSINKFTYYSIEKYINNIYFMIKIINDNKNTLNTNYYIKILISEMTQNEFLLVYYFAHGLDDECKYKKEFLKLLEKNHFFKWMFIRRFDSNPKDKKNPFPLYSPSAFKDN